MAPPGDAAAQPKDLYHHFIPRFILRQFQVFPAGQLELNPRVRAEWPLWKGGRARKKGGQRVCYYNITTGTLELRGLARIYGRPNLYRDLKDPVDVHSLEHALAGLEQASCFIIKSIHSSLPVSSFSLPRKDLATLRKFIFLMHYRNDAFSLAYFSDKNPKEPHLGEWMRKFKVSRQLDAETDIWLTGLRYYLETPHHTIVSVGEGLRERYGDQPISEMLQRRFDPAIEEWYAIDYESLASYFFLGVWEAADDTEFVLGTNSFGLWEGLIYGSPGAHRLYVVSPRVALVLRRTFLHHPHSNDPSILYSCLADIPIAQPTIEYADKFIFQRMQDEDPWIRKSAFDAYRATPKAQDDRFTFRITKLSREQTYAVNEVIIMNASLHPNGSLTYASSKAMFDTLETYMSSHNTFMGGKRALFHPLLQKLQALKVDDFRLDALLNVSKPQKVKGQVKGQVKAKTAKPTSVTNIFSPPPPSPVDSNSDADHQLTIFLRFTIEGGITFPSSYNRAYLLLCMATDRSISNPISKRIQDMQDAAVSRLRLLLDPPLPAIDIPQESQAKIAETLPKEESELFFSLVGHMIDQLEVGRYSNDLLANLIYEASIVGVTRWLAKERKDVLFDLLYPIDSTGYVEAYEATGSTTSARICLNYIANLAATQGDDDEWRGFNPYSFD
ncbi:hypothetical protein NLJ89_g7409 [Agrocybe chaxingu]|uniref:Uncharacterized protein n=1 Tax=Agrocybe chaxingu TaxID=84603 RepID=A0A9W8JWQ9_9AGAR|nr:hypothetical protein NLJ89_g7409 [Agrocybe chaxingu]